MSFREQCRDVLAEQLKSENVTRTMKEASAIESRDGWYEASYLPILRVFDETRGSANVEAWALRKCMVFSWLGRIPACGICPTAARQLTKVERSMSDAALGESNTHFSDGTVSFGTSLVSVGRLIDQANHLLNLGTSGNLASCSKLLHFMLPRLLPILDSRVLWVLSGKARKPASHQELKAPATSQYLSYLMELEAYLSTGDNLARLGAQSPVGPLSALRVADLVLFRRYRQL